MIPPVIWFTGLASAGKSTLAHEVLKRYRGLGAPVVHLDGDEIRRTLSKDLGFSRKDRMEQVRRVYRLAGESVREGNVVIVSLISPHRALRAEARALLDPFVEVFVSCPLSICEARDVKGLYRRARNREIIDFTGIDSEYEEPESPEIVLRTDLKPVGECADDLWRFLSARGLTDALKF